MVTRENEKIIEREKMRAEHEATIKRGNPSKRSTEKLEKLLHSAYINHSLTNVSDHEVSLKSQFKGNGEVPAIRVLFSSSTYAFSKNGVTTKPL